MSTDTKGAVPRIVVEIKDGVAQVRVANWHGVTNTTMSGIEFKIERAIHEWRAAQLLSTRRKEQQSAAA